ncbi:MAG: hypothetical protein H0A76_11265 [Candidatus Thiodubiliella endoseptemdiera]|uniref:DUF3530 family protein n=1 Tax=Candidatus Thiodubiliella endoseptemdiera TaxID=2738886 RepID=A0A853F312_9GAMM|nr:hypothetical protein [Candidatus Thiodubiliella endoseptemdiera]
MQRSLFYNEFICSLRWIMKILSILLLVSNFSFAQTTPDYAKEGRWATQVEDGLMDGEVVWLNANGHKFMSLYTPSETKTKRTALIIHGLGAHPIGRKLFGHCALH